MNLPEITDEDIAAAEQRLEFQFDEARRDFLKYMDTLDVQSCAGSGKTTLLVTKLDILARKWTSRSQGICVLSHTNVAKDEIKKRLGGSVSGIKLLSPPHFIGTIQEFVNRFLALPYLRSGQYPFKYIDNDLFAERAKAIGTSRDYIKPKSYYEKRKDSFEDVVTRLTLQAEESKFSVVAMFGNQNSLPSATSDTYKRLCGLKKKLIDEGVWRFDDMFAIAKVHLANNQSIIQTLQHRFPLLLIDETQDTQSQQLDLLETIFPHEDCVVQRLGDANQAIYFSTGAVDGVSFPRNSADALDLNTTHRFGQWIADQASTTTVIKQQLESQSDNRCFGHTIFLYDDQSIMQVLPAFADLISQHKWNGHCHAHAVGAIGKDGDALNIGDYWDGYDRSVRSKSASPSTLIGFARLAQTLHRTDGNLHQAIPKIRDGVIRLAKKMEIEPKDVATLTWNRLCDLYQDKRERLKQLNRWIYSLVTCGGWEEQSDWEEQVNELKTYLSTIGGDISKDNGFCAWNDTPTSTITASAPAKINVFEHNGIEIKVGTIHSVKGETHDATLVLETKWYDGDIKQAIQWLTNTKAQPPSQFRQKERFKRLHVAMTRPRHLLCMAINSAHINDEQKTTLKSVGWQITDLREQQ